MPKSREQLRTDYELKVLRDSLCRDARTKGEALQVVIKYAYDRLHADRLSGTKRDDALISHPH